MPTLKPLSAGVARCWRWLNGRGSTVTAAQKPDVENSVTEPQIVSCPVAGKLQKPDVSPSLPGLCTMPGAIECASDAPAEATRLSADDALGIAQLPNLAAGSISDCQLGRQQCENREPSTAHDCLAFENPVDRCIAIPLEKVSLATYISATFVAEPDGGGDTGVKPHPSPTSYALATSEISARRNTPEALSKQDKNSPNVDSMRWRSSVEEALMPQRNMLPPPSAEEQSSFEFPAVRQTALVEPSMQEQSSFEYEAMQERSSLRVPTVQEPDWFDEPWVESASFVESSFEASFIESSLSEHSSAERGNSFESVVYDRRLFSDPSRQERGLPEAPPMQRRAAADPLWGVIPADAHRRTREDFEPPRLRPDEAAGVSSVPVERAPTCGLARQRLGQDAVEGIRNACDESGEASKWAITRPGLSARGLRRCANHSAPSTAPPLAKQRLPSWSVAQQTEKDSFARQHSDDARTVTSTGTSVRASGIDFQRRLFSRFVTDLH